LVLDGAEVQSDGHFQHGVLECALESDHWVPHSTFTDSSFGFEVWTGPKGTCHSGVLFKPSGHLGLLDAKPDEYGNCFGDPVPGEEQAYVEVSNWDAIRASPRIEFTLTWAPDSVTLKVSDGGSQQGEAVYNGPVIPSRPMRVRLYAHTFEGGRADAFKVDYVRLLNTDQH
jgi:hypothetical protein